MTWPKCPVCGTVDEVQSASAAVAAGRAWATPRGLALRLADPRCPKWRDSTGSLGNYRWGWLYGAVIVAVIIGAPLLAAQALIGVLVMVVVMLIGLIIAGRRTWDTRALVKYNRAVEAWNESVARKWLDLYYCHRCDRVFTPGDPSAVSPEEWGPSLGRSPQERWPQEELARAADVANLAEEGPARSGVSGEE